MKRIAINFVEITTDLPERVQLIPAGAVVGRDGRSWVLDDPQQVVNRFIEQGADLPVDIEHSTELRAPKGEPAPAAGWVHQLEVIDGAIWGAVNWNETGRGLVGGKQYRYLSPVILYSPGDGSIKGLTSVALTNRPNLHLPALNFSEPENTGSVPFGSGPANNKGGMTPEEQPMLKAVLAALGLPEDVTEEATAVNAVKELNTKLATAMNAQPSLEKFVPRADYDQAMTRATNAEQGLATIQKEKLDSEIETAINAALAAGKITPATVDYHRAQCRQEGGLERFAAFVAAAPAIGDPSGLDGKELPGAASAMNAEQARIAEMFGNTAEDLAKYGA
jgi:phage I-like protein